MDRLLGRVPRNGHSTGYGGWGIPYASALARGMAAHLMKSSRCLGSRTALHADGLELFSSV